MQNNQANEGFLKRAQIHVFYCINDRTRCRKAFLNLAEFHTFKCKFEIRVVKDSLFSCSKYIT